MVRLDAATVMLQWAVGGWLFLWVTTRRREVGIGYGWLMRFTFLVFLGISLAAAVATDVVIVREMATIGVIATGGYGLVESYVRRRAGVAGQRAEHDRRSARVAAMTGIEREVVEARSGGPEFRPVLDLIPVAFGVVGLVAAGVAAGGNDVVAVWRMLAGAAFLGAVSDAMLLGHWYLVQPGLARGPLLELVRWVAITWPFEVIGLLLPTGMISVLIGSIDDGYGGILGWFWVACVISTIALVGVTWLALKERYYSAVMAATGLLYLAILTAFGTDLVARAILS